MVIAELNKCVNKSDFSIQKLVDLTMKKELMEQVERWYRSLSRLQTLQDRKAFLEYVQGISFSQGIYHDENGLFVIESAHEFSSLLGPSGAFRPLLEREQNIWVVCLDPVDIVVIVRNEADRVYIEEESTYFYLWSSSYLMRFI